MLSPVPDWMERAAPVTTTDANRLNPLRKSWGALSQCIAELSEEDLLKIILLEFNDEKRPLIVARCLSRFNRVRARRERKELFASLVSGG